MQHVHGQIQTIKSSVFTIVVLSMITGFGMATVGCKKADASKKDASTTPPPPEVVAVKVISKDVPDYKYYPGITQAVIQADMVARVEGYLEERSFVEGSDVEAGQRLYLIQQDEYEAALAEAVASLAEAKANLSFERFTRDETARAMSKGAATEYEMDQAQANYEVGLARVASAQASLINAELNLSYTDVIAPFAGRIGDTKINVGNLVGPNMNTTLATLVMLDPMRVIFEPAGNDLTDFSIAREAGNLDVQVTVAGTDGSKTEYNGVLDLIDNEVNQQTSTFLARAVFPNKKKQVLPGMYVNLRIRLRMLPNTMVVPDDAVRSGPRDQYVFIINSDDEIARQIVMTGSIYKGFRVIKSGLKIGQQVLVAGDPTKVKANVKVKVQLKDADAFVEEVNKKAMEAASTSSGVDTNASSEKAKQGKTQESSAPKESGSSSKTNTPSEKPKTDEASSGANEAPQSVSGGADSQ